MSIKLVFCLRMFFLETVVVYLTKQYNTVK